MKTMLLIAVTITAVPLIASAEPVDDLRTCIATRDAKQRLACFDRVARSVVSYDEGVKAATEKSLEAKAKQDKEAREAKEKQDQEATQKELAGKEFIAGRDALSALKKMQAQVKVGVSLTCPGSLDQS